MDWFPLLTDVAELSLDDLSKSFSFVFSASAVFSSTAGPNGFHIFRKMGCRNLCQMYNNNLKTHSKRISRRQ